MDTPAYPDTPRYKLLEYSLKRAEREYAELCDNWKLIETKAQATTTSSGLLTGLIGAVIGKYGLTIPEYQQVYLVLIATLLVVTVFQAIGAMRVQLYDTPFGAGHYFDKFSRVASNFNMDDFYQTLVEDLHDWARSNNEVHKEILKKAARLYRAQTCLQLAIFFIFAASVHILFLDKQAV